ncbi:bifunctional 2-polyprenyl-6-hydroxyphenol methylase/3-demethylubiquinol 3-O-methyltransferase UbiG [Salinisphaera sp. Q1T1-3]|uniref:bifunctional 2-polyprenyl-6-hydroxyphenol methylase/3-demethylubiquinol 3-O-methyltransferase UbiG n=1 Tax=Salinisphaera sp. Q1T1-3 TaxID=2321229 RepID=UPI000E70FF4F|nr:bifunctional 2-polyprenyl-6-hydroxyphenol methylase/3-demethylubiquinol 3-O-methyltransferase UbiG [Salinisphaera sp. Q1T1-3]RJS92691.1 bifunctional 2-polyprenyl-6-hydroxyphenol methylase/3-demethylubiquinol 3-O-methyltransferase UbiG [Salinisphaera sp. Q1T1-3]
MPSDQKSELNKFDAMAATWWDPDGDMRPLHDINPLRCAYIDRRAGLKGKRVLDVGCGAGVLSEAMARRGARVTGIDLAGDTVEAAKRHAAQSDLSIDYRVISSRDLAAEMAGAFDIVVAYEMLEHVDEPGNVVGDCALLTAAGGDLFFSTINRNPLSWALAIGGAEYVLGLLPRGTHEYAKLIKPAELSHWCRTSGLDVRDLTGMRYNPLSRNATLGHRPDVNYFIHAEKPSA